MSKRPEELFQFNPESPEAMRGIWERFKARIRAYSDKGGLFEVVLRPFQSTRTIAQNARYWAMLAEIADFSGHDVEALHEWCKCRWLGYVEVDIKGKSYAVPRSTTSLGVQEFAEYMTRVEVWAATDLRMALPAPEWYGQAVKPERKKIEKPAVERLAA